MCEVEGRVGLGECLEPCLAALLAHDASRAPRCQVIVEALVGSADGFEVRGPEARGVEVREIAHSIIGCLRHYPGITAVAECPGKAFAILKEKARRDRERGIYRLPIDRIVEIDIEIGYHRLVDDLEIRAGGEIFLLDVLQ